MRLIVPFVQFEKREKHPWRIVTLSKLKADVCNCTKSNVPPWVFFTFLNFKNFVKLRKTSQIYNVELGKAFYIDIGFGVFLNGK